jgi:hypothetical protein
MRTNSYDQPINILLYHAIILYILFKLGNIMFYLQPRATILQVFIPACIWILYMEIARWILQSEFFKKAELGSLFLSNHIPGRFFMQTISYCHTRPYLGNSAQLKIYDKSQLARWGHRVALFSE